MHTHRYPVRITVIKSNIKQYIGVPYDKSAREKGIELSEFEYKSPLNGGQGLKYLRETKVNIKEFSTTAGSTIETNENEYHIMSC
ncbi:MAG: hypothetical protein LBM02_09805 [Lachnospiraceae bacterium]|nr:hypothetical protein [Lachnospiraceae bacterium]